MTEERAMGLAIAALCLLGLWHARWFVARTRKGRWLEQWFGPEKGLWLLRLLLALGAILGLLLAGGILRPVRW